MRDLSKSTWKLPALAGLFIFTAYFTDTLVPNFVAFLPMLAWLEANREATARERMGAGLVFGLVSFSLLLHWLYSMLEFTSLAVLLYAGLLMVYAAGVSISIGFAGWIRLRTGLSYSLILPACWLPLEWVRTWGDLRITADHIGHSMAKFPFLVQFADLVGPYGVGAFVLAVNGMLFDLLWGRRGARKAAGLALAGLLGVVLAYDLWAWNREIPAERTVRVGIVQPNIPLEVKWDDMTAGAQWAVLTRLTAGAAEEGAELVVWPESANPIPLREQRELPGTYKLAAPQNLAQRLGVSVVVGSEYYVYQEEGGLKYYNAAFAVHADGRLDPVWAAKAYLVPFTEQVPWKPVLGWLLKDRGGDWGWVAGGFDPGPRAMVLPFEDLPVGIMVCYEELYFDLARSLRNNGAKIQAVITNDAWFGRSLFQRYQADILRMRAIENRTSIVRAANTGISGFVDPRGAYIERGLLLEEKYYVQDLPVTSIRTVYDRIGDLVAWLAIAGFVVLVVRSRLAGRAAQRLRSDEPGPDGETFRVPPRDPGPR